MPTSDRYACLIADIHAAAKHFTQHIQPEQIEGPTDEVDSSNRVTTHRINIRNSGGSSDAAPVIWIVEHRGEKVGGRDYRSIASDANSRSIVAVFYPHNNVGVIVANESRDSRFKLTSRN